MSNSLGTVFKISSFGESHGRCLTAVIENFPASVGITAADVNRDLARRQMGYGRGDRMKIESDSCEILSGVRGGRTLGSPISFIIRNEDWANWEQVMNPGENDPSKVAEKRVTNPRPGYLSTAITLPWPSTASPAGWNR